MNKMIFGLMGMALVTISTAQAGEYLVGQQDKSFVKDGAPVEAMTIKKGETIRFQNEDPFFHNIFSLSELATFDLGSFPKGDSRTVKFDEAGMVEIECAIHPDMYLEVEVK